MVSTLSTLSFSIAILLFGSAKAPHGGTALGGDVHQAHRPWIPGDSETAPEMRKWGRKPMVVAENNGKYGQDP